MISKIIPRKTKDIEQGKRFSQAVVSNLPIKSSCNQRTFLSIKEKELLINAFYSNKSVKQKRYDKNYIEKIEISIICERNRDILE